MVPGCAIIQGNRGIPAYSPRLREQPLRRVYGCCIQQATRQSGFPCDDSGIKYSGRPLRCQAAKQKNENPSTPAHNHPLGTVMCGGGSNSTAIGRVHSIQFRGLDLRHIFQMPNSQLLKPIGQCRQDNLRCHLPDNQKSHRTHRFSPLVKVDGPCSIHRSPFSVALFV